MTSAVYDVPYVGSVALPRSTTSIGLGALQRPILDLYVTYLPPSSSKSSTTVVARQLPQRRLTLTERGLIISAIDALPSRCADNDAFYAMPAVVFWEAVRSRMYQLLASHGRSHHRDESIPSLAVRKIN